MSMLIGRASSYIAQPVGEGFPYWEIWDLQMGILGLFNKVEGGWWYSTGWSRLAQNWVSLWKGNMDECSEFCMASEKKPLYNFG